MAEQATDATQSEAGPEAPPRYRVTGEFVNVKTMGMAGIIHGRSGFTVVGIHKHGLLPADAPAEDVERLLGKGMIEQVPA